MTKRARIAREAAVLRWGRGRILAAYDAATEAERIAGREWYSRAERAAADVGFRARLDTSAGAAVIAALSPRERWSKNVEYATLAAEAAGHLRGDPLFGDPDSLAGAAHAAIGRLTLTDSVRKAARILAGDDPADVLGGPKTRAFWRNLTGDPEAVTVDVWAATLFYGTYRHQISPRQYRIAADGYRAAAEARGIEPREMQATTWIHVRGSAA